MQYVANVVSAEVDAASFASDASFGTDAIYKPFFGEPAQVVDAIESLADLGFARVRNYANRTGGLEPQVAPGTFWGVAISIPS